MILPRLRGSGILTANGGWSGASCGRVSVAWRRGPHLGPVRARHARCCRRAAGAVSSAHRQWHHAKRCSAASAASRRVPAASGRDRAHGKRCSGRDRAHHAKRCPAARAASRRVPAASGRESARPLRAAQNHCCRGRHVGGGARRKRSMDQERYVRREARRPRALWRSCCPCNRV